MLVGSGVIYNRFIDFSLQTEYLVLTGSINESIILNENLIINEESIIKEALEINQDKIIIYFSSCGVLDEKTQDSEYTLHKLRMERLIIENSKKYYIFRLPNIIGNIHGKMDLINNFINSINNDFEIRVWKNTKRYFIDIDDAYEIIKEILDNKILLNKIINIGIPIAMEIKEVLNEIEIICNKKSNYRYVENKSNYNIDFTDVMPIINNLKINYNKNYFRNSLQKYYNNLNSNSKLISIIVPTYNEEKGIIEFYNRTIKVLLSLSPRFKYEIIFVNDFSTDKTSNKLEILANLDKNVKVINFSRNFGNQKAIAAGIDHSKGDLAVIIDDDLQDPPEIIINMISKWEKGFKVVYGVRPKRIGVSTLFKLIAKYYYRFLNNISETTIPVDTGDFRLIDRVVLNSLKKIGDESLYYRGLVAWVGYSQIGVLYNRDSRFAGKSTFNLFKYFNFAINGLTSFTEKPLYISSFIGVIITLISFIISISLIIKKLNDPFFSVEGWTSIIIIVLFFGGIQLFFIGILGIYIGKIFSQVKGRPRYVISDIKNIDD